MEHECEQRIHLSRSLQRGSSASATHQRHGARRRRAAFAIFELLTCYRAVVQAGREAALDDKAISGVDDSAAPESGVERDVDSGGWRVRQRAESNEILSRRWRS